MKELLHVTNSDATNLYGDRFTAGAIISSLYDNCVSVKALRYQTNGIAIELRYFGLGLTKDDLIAIAESMK